MAGGEKAYINGAMAVDQFSSSACVRPALMRLVALSVALDIIIADQISKWAVLEWIVRPAAGAGESLGIFEWLFSSERLPYVRVEVLPFFNIVMVWNQGVSFGMLGGGVAPLALVGLALLITGVFGVWLTRTTRWVEAVACALVIGGAVGNIVDRLRFGAVADFLDIHVAGYHWPAFNLADSCITLGILVVLFDALFLAPGRGRREVIS